MTVKCWVILYSSDRVFAVCTRDRDVDEVLEGLAQSDYDVPEVVEADLDVSGLLDAGWRAP